MRLIIIIFLTLSSSFGYSDQIRKEMICVTNDTSKTVSTIQRYYKDDKLVMIIYSSEKYSYRTFYGAFPQAVTEMDLNGDGFYEYRIFFEMGRIKPEEAFYLDKSGEVQPLSDSGLIDLGKRILKNINWADIRKKVEEDLGGGSP